MEKAEGSGSLWNVNSWHWYISFFISVIFILSIVKGEQKLH